MKIILLLFLFYYGFPQIKTNSYNIFEVLKEKNITCDLHSFVIRSNETVNNDYRIFNNDLQEYCFNSSSAKFSKLICHMITIELELACTILNQSRSVPIVYNSQYTSKQICSQKSVVLTNNWIWDKLTSQEKEPVGSSSINLCSFITTNEETLRLVRFFYRLALRLRRINSTNFVVQSESFANKTVDLQKPVLNNETIIISEEKLSITNKTEANNPPRGPMLEGLVADKKPEIVKEELIQVEENNKNNETKKSEEGLPLGRAGEKPEREQVNERPKPKPLDANVVFQQNGNDEHNWVQGKNVDNKVQDPLVNNLNKLSNIKIDENPVVIPQAVKKRPLSRFRFSRHSDDADDGGDLSQGFITSVLIAILCFVLLYLILHNKNKVLGLIIEGCKRRRRTANHHVRLSQSVY